MERLQLTYILDYPYRDRGIETHLSAALFNRIEQFRVMKQKKYAEEVDEAEIGPFEINYEYAYSDVTHEKLVEAWREMHGVNRYKRDYAIEDSMNKEFRSTVAFLSGSGDFFPQIGINRSSQHYFYHLYISCQSDHDTLIELGTFIAEAFRVIPRERIIEAAMSGDVPELVALNKVFRLAHDVGEPRDATLAVYIRAMHADDAAIQEDVVSELWADVAYEKGLIARALEKEVIAMEQRFVSQQVPEDNIILTGLRDILAELKQL